MGIFEEIPDELLGAIPGYMHPGLRRYLNGRCAPGGFLRCVIQGNWEVAEREADCGNRACLGGWLRLQESLPDECKGENYYHWINGVSKHG